MNKGLKIGLIITGVLAVAGGLYLALKKPKTEDEVAKEPSIPQPTSTTGVIGKNISNGSYIKPTGSSANVRSSANTTSSIVENISSGNIIGKVVANTTVNGYIWLGVETLSGKKGYVRSDIVSITEYKIADTDKWKYGTKVLANKDNVEVYDENSGSVISKISKYSLIGTVISIYQGGVVSVNLTNPVIITYPTYKKYTTGLVKTSDIS